MKFFALSLVFLMNFLSVYAAGYEYPRYGYEHPGYGYENPRYDYESLEDGYEYPGYGYEKSGYGYEYPKYNYRNTMAAKRPVQKRNSQTTASRSENARNKSQKRAS